VLSTWCLEEYADVQAHLASAVETLSKEFEGIFEREYCRALVEESAGQLEGSAVASFIPILAHRFARERLNEARRVRDDIERRLDGLVADLQSRALVGSAGVGRG
jgi:hypothetical protein